VARVLIVDDEPEARIILGNVLERAGHTVDFASNGKEALRLYLEWSFDVVVTDLHMPEGDGLEFIKALRAILPETVIVAVSGKGPELLAEAENEGVLAALSKPIDPHVLLETVARAVSGDEVSSLKE
jgi:CheY-like chemotaxis protein